jgi:uncharacterized protein GlcG (DUF336 family)
MHTTKEPDKKLLAEIYHTLEESTGLLHSILLKTNHSEFADQLRQIDQRLRHSQQQIVETVIKDVVTSINQSNKVKWTDINLTYAIALIKEVEMKAAQMGISVVTAVYNSSANPVAIHCMDGAYIASFDIASNKAYTSAALKMPTSVLKNLSQPGQELYGIQFTNQGRIVIFGGGEPLYYDNKLIGALGVSGGSESEDTKLAEFGKDRMEEVMKW